jgi:ATP-dependent helicase YprA (DUF1998 family)/very-short-patch-repair endonuclease
LDVFALRNHLIEDYADYVRSFIAIRDERIRSEVDSQLEAGRYWPDPLIQLNAGFEPGGSIDELIAGGLLHPECSRIFQREKDAAGSVGKPLRLHRHQADAVRAARTGKSYVLTTGTGSGKSLAYILPIVDSVLRDGAGRGVRAIVVYPMNALANSQAGELEKFLCHGYAPGKEPVRFARYTGQESEDERQQIIAHPPDILLTNYVMLELLLTRTREQALVRAARGLRFLVLDELHVYRGRQGADVAMLVRRTREAFRAPELQCIGTSATLATDGSFDEQRAEIARVAGALFGTPVEPAHVIGETLRRDTPEFDFTDPGSLAQLRERIASHAPPPIRYDDFIADPLSSWIESSFGIRRDEQSGRLRRVPPRSIDGTDGAAELLAQQTELPERDCGDAIAAQLIASYGSDHRHPETGFPVFAFRLHQFISRGDTAYATLEREDERRITLHGQIFVPGDRSRALLPLVFCRECGQEYYCVRAERDESTGARSFRPRELSDRLRDDEAEAGFLFLDSSEPWPSGTVEELDRIPDDWLEESPKGVRVRRDRRDWLPKPVRVDPAGAASEDGLLCSWLPAPFRFCLRCGMAYGFRQTTDFGKLSSLGTEGRSTATTILSLATVRHLRRDERLDHEAMKLLSFTDNRQDASLQAGHLNDFVEVGLLRSALYRAVDAAGESGLAHDELVQRVFDALALPFESYASDPEMNRFAARQETDRALRSVLGYRIYRDLERGWRVTSPNLEQCGLLKIEYASLAEVCEAEDLWQRTHPTLAAAAPEDRQQVARALLDLMRRELAIKVGYLDERDHERIQQQSAQRLRAPWGLDEEERLEHAKVLYPRSRSTSDWRGDFYLSPRGGFSQYLRRRTTFPNHDEKLKIADTEQILIGLLETLRRGGLVERVKEPDGDGGVAGYQLPASALIWTAGSGQSGYHDPIRMPQAPQGGRRVNPFFVRFYQEVGRDGIGIEAREHTAQVDPAVREEREEAFRSGALPILYCSPTMELGIDIRDLNAVNLRNVPPTPANYAQRSGRAGRSGQPALVFTYCSTYRSHDQYFFRRPGRMVAGAVAPPRIDLANEALVRAHIHAIWLAESGIDLKHSLRDVLDVSGATPSLEILPDIRDDLDRVAPRARARERAARLLATIQDELKRSDWYSEDWLDDALARIPREFESACNRWRGLYRAAIAQRDLQHRIIADASRSADDKAKARRLRSEAEAQLELLGESVGSVQSDFYSYRYFASEGFLPGYSFPRLPLSAYIPGRKRRGRKNDEFVSRPRFLAISEFGPRAVVYHEGVRYRINRVILPIEREGDHAQLALRGAKQCEQCGYLHPLGADDNGPDLCERCGVELGHPIRALFRMESVSTRRTDRINSDEEERLRLGFEIRSGVRFAEHRGRPSQRRAAVSAADGKPLLDLAYGDTATLWRINVGWKRRARKDDTGFLLDTERGYWAKNQLDEGDAEDPLSASVKRVIPYVEDWRNCLLVEPAQPLDGAEIASLESSLRRAIQVEYQLEEVELASEPLPSRSDRRLLLFYESAEGGAGVLRRLVDDPRALPRLARRALEICHFDPETGIDEHRHPQATEDCEAACYDCLLSYTNQQDHDHLDRARIAPLLRELAAARVETSPGPRSRADHLAELKTLCDSALEQEWLDYIAERQLRLPERAQHYYEPCQTRFDFAYLSDQTAVYIDGPHHAYPHRRARDAEQTSRLEDRGWTVVRFTAQEDWASVIARWPSLFGALPPAPAAPRPAEEGRPRFEPGWFAPAWLAQLAPLAQEGIEIEAGRDVREGTTIVGRTVAELRGPRGIVVLIDAGAPGAEAVASAIRAEGGEAIVLDPGASDCEAMLRAAVGG